jgi:hypothetical protein
MNTFFLIIKKYFKITDNTFQNLDSLQKIIFFMFISKKEVSLEIKFKYFNDQINNIFLTEEQKNDFINIFCKIQKIYFALSRFAYIYKYKKAKIVVDFDLCLNPIDINNKNSICLLQEKNKYYFRINDLINIINTSLANSPMFFSEPLISKNPYNNIPFNKSTLYNIYFNIISKTFIVSELINKFFLSNFDLDKFEKDNEYLIREHSIQKYVKNTDIDTLYNLILLMIDNYNDDYNNYNDNDNKIIIHKNFPKKILVDVMRPYLNLYYSYKYSLINTKKLQSKNILYKKLRDFYVFNPSFGRQQIKINHYFTKNKNKKYKNIYTYNDKHIIFYEESKSFLTSHLSDK